MRINAYPKLAMDWMCSIMNKIWKNPICYEGKKQNGLICFEPHIGFGASILKSMHIQNMILCPFWPFDFFNFCNFFFWHCISIDLSIYKRSNPICFHAYQIRSDPNLICFDLIRSRSTDIYQISMELGRSFCHPLTI